MKEKSKPVTRKPSKAAKTATKSKTARIAAETVAADEGRLVAVLRQLVRICGDMRDLLAEIRDLLAERRKEGGEAEAEPDAGVETVIVAETEDGEDFE
jgi:hypothetical protein